MRRPPDNYEPAPDFEGHYRIKDGHAVAWWVIGWETRPLAVIYCECGYHAFEREHGGGKVLDKGDKDCNHENACYSDEPDYERTGQLICRMVGDDSNHLFDPSDLIPISEGDYCGSCGQIGCGWC